MKIIPYQTIKFKRWDTVIDYLMTKEWHITNAYLSAYPTISRDGANTASSNLLANVKFQQRFEELQRTKYGLSKERIAQFWLQKVDTAKKEENSLRASENLAKYLGMYSDTPSQPVINIQVGIKNGGVEP